MFEQSLKNGLRGLFLFFMPDMFKYIRLKMLDKDVTEFMMSTVKQTIDYRVKNNAPRKDLLQLLMQLHETGNVQNDGEWDTKSSATATSASLIKFLSLTSII